MMSFDLAKIKDLNLAQSLYIDGICCNSSHAKENYAYFAVKGENFDGNDFINHAIENGAKIIFSEQDFQTQYGDIVYIKCDDVRKTMALIASLFYQDKPENIVAVTGTNGKTSVAGFYRQILHLMGKKSASIGTVGLYINDQQIEDSNLTTPDSISLNKMLNDLSSKQVEYVSLEASSHGLMQKRLLGIKLKAAAFTNFTQDHLDYHGSMEEYFKAKKKLFSENLEPDTICVLNSDIVEYDSLREICKNHQIIDYGKNAKTIKITNISNNIDCQIIDFTYDWKSYSIKTEIIGEFQAYNLLCAASLAIASSMDKEQVFACLSRLKNIVGRMQKFHNIFVDYAHTPDALEKALMVLKPICERRLISLFGCGGNRDNKKRSLMGAIASNISDLVIVTDDNPRFEDPSLIRKEIISGIEKENYIEISDRKEAIKKALAMLEKGDVLLIAGKGHENYQIINDIRHYFDDMEIVKSYYQEG